MSWIRFVLPVVVSVLTAGIPTLATGAGKATDAAQRAAHLLDYIAVDYAEAVRAGEIIDPFEYAEQLEFVAQVGAFLGELEGDPSDGGLEQLETAVRERAAAEIVEDAARALSAQIRSRYGARISLREPPRRDAGGRLFALHCANCHGDQGRGDGPAGAGLDPPPSDLGDPARMNALSPFTIYSTISYGIDGTGMVGYAPTLSERERLDLTFFAASLSAPAELVARGRRAVANDPETATAIAGSLDALFELVPQDLPPERRAVVAYLVSQPEVLVGGSLPLEIARARLADARDAHRRGETQEAIRFAVSAYLDGFEYLEPALALADPSLRDDTEAELMAFRTALRDQRDPEAIEAPYRRISALFDRAAALLEQRGLSSTTTFLASFAILAREGLEAILLIAAILAIVSRATGSEAQRGKRAVHVGWIGALLCGGLTWWAASSAIELSGADREIVEGFAALLAAAVLVWVSYWLFSRLDVEKWQAFLAARLEAAAAKGSLWVLGALAFVAVYREAFETVLFYQALAAQGARDQPAALWGGAAAALALLAAPGTAIFVVGKRLPLRAFFAASSVLLYVFAMIFAGQGIAAFQEADVISATAVPFPQISWLGLSPTLEGLGLQGLLLALGLAAVPLSGAFRRSASAAP